MAYFYRIAVSLIFFGLAVYMFLSLPFFGRHILIYRRLRGREPDRAAAVLEARHYAATQRRPDGQAVQRLTQYTFDFHAYRVPDEQDNADPHHRHEYVYASARQAFGYISGQLIDSRTD